MMMILVSVNVSRSTLQSIAVILLPVSKILFAFFALEFVTSIIESSYLAIEIGRHRVRARLEPRDAVLPRYYEYCTAAVCTSPNDTTLAKKLELYSGLSLHQPSILLR